MVGCSVRHRVSELVAVRGSTARSTGHGDGTLRQVVLCRSPIECIAL